MPNQYVYSISADMPGGAVNEAKLHAEIVASAIGTVLNSVRADMNVLTVTFTGDLSAGDKTIFDGDTTGPAGGLLAAHDNTASENGNALRYSSNSGQSISNVAITIVDFENHDFGDAAGHVTTGAAWKYTVPEAGRYFVYAMVYFPNLSMDLGEFVQGFIEKNGVIEYQSAYEFSATNVVGYGIKLSGLLNCIA